MLAIETTLYDEERVPKSVVLTDEGAQRAEELFHELFGVQHGDE